mmetsp:Transcript_19959/g.56316  ORF Transcript_19959/g.56316 Transcript_19959/m.56316 type:complete len:186 (-) Transcript_19959:2-559(-)
MLALLPQPGRASGAINFTLVHVRRWVVVPALYSPQLALGILSRLGGPRSVLLRHPYAAEWGAHEGGEVAVSADELDDALRLILGKVSRSHTAPAATGENAGNRGEGWIPPRRVVAAIQASRLLPGFVDASSTAGDEAAADAFGLLIAEELVPSTALPQDGKRGWFDPTMRGLIVHAPAAGPQAKT